MKVINNYNSWNAEPLLSILEKRTVKYFLGLTVNDKCIFNVVTALRSVIIAHF